MQTAPTFREQLVSGTFGKHDLRGLVEISAPVCPFMPTGTQYPEISNPVLIEERHHLLAVLQRNVGFGKSRTMIEAVTILLR